MIHLDTHVLVWLYAGLHERIPPVLREDLEVETLAVSPMVCLELGHLHEIGRVTHRSSRIIDELGRALGLTIDRAPFVEVAAVAQSERFHFTRDPFDRIIAAQAVVAGAELATKDRRILTHLDIARWD